jgi:hypothetical protein
MSSGCIIYVGGLPGDVTQTVREGAPPAAAAVALAACAAGPGCCPPSIAPFAPLCAVLLPLCTQKECNEIFDRYGRIARVSIKPGRDRHETAFAFVEYSDPRDASDAVRAMDGREAFGKRLRVSVCRGLCAGAESAEGAVTRQHSSSPRLPHVCAWRRPHTQVELSRGGRGRDDGGRGGYRWGVYSRANSVRHARLLLPGRARTPPLTRCVALRSPPSCFLTDPPPSVCPACPTTETSAAAGVAAEPVVFKGLTTRNFASLSRACRPRPLGRRVQPGFRVLRASSSPRPPSAAQVVG